MKKKKKVLLSVLISFLILLNLFAVNVQAEETIASGQVRTYGDYFVVYPSNNAATMVVESGGKFNIRWSGTDSFDGGMGWNPGSDQNVIYSGNFNATGSAILALYGWTKNPLVEYYVVENYGDWIPTYGASIGTVQTDGGTYNIYKNMRVNAPSIIGTTTFYQYYSVRTSKRSSGTITFQNHINAWKSKGMELGSIWDFQIMMVEGYNSNGNSSITVSAVPAIHATNTPTQTPIIPEDLKPVINDKRDLNGDGYINMSDLFILAGSYNTKIGHPRYVEAYDLDGDGAINMSDVMLIGAKFNTRVAVATT